MTAVSLLVGVLIAPVVAQPCEHYFGNVSGLVTVADPDIGVPGRPHSDLSGKYCDTYGAQRPCTYIHYAGLHTQCQRPAPPDNCHRYHKVTYSSECQPVLNKLHLTATVDKDLKFTREGVLKDCQDYVRSNEVFCWAPPADDPQRCDCPKVVDSPPAKEVEEEPSVQSEAPTCSDYFGDVSGLITVANPDVGAPGRTAGSCAFCKKMGTTCPCNFIHYAGLKTACINPAPPDACHDYRKVEYTEGCRSVLQNLNLTGKVDTDHLFTQEGVLKECEKYVKSVKSTCWGPPANNAQHCECSDEIVV